MADYVIRRNKGKLFWFWLLLLGLALVCSAVSLALLLSFDLGNLNHWTGLLLFGFTAIVASWGSVVFAGQLFLASSEFLKLTQEGFYYTGYGIGRKVYFSSWQEVDRIFYTEVEVRAYRGHRGYQRYISVDFKKPDLWMK